MERKRDKMEEIIRVGVERGHIVETRGGTHEIHC